MEEENREINEKLLNIEQIYNNILNKLTII